MLGLNSDSKSKISIALTTAPTQPTVVFAAQGCGDSYYMSSCDFTGGANWIGTSAAVAGVAALISLNWIEKFKRS